MLGRDHLEHRFNSLWARVGAVGDPLPVLQDLFWRYGEDGRAYHTIEHIRDCLSEFDSVKSSASDPESMEFGFWFHDVILVRGARRGENEEASGQLAAAVMRNARIGRDIIAKTYQHILNTCHDGVPKGYDQQLLVDIDLSILGRATDVFNRYEAQIRVEYEYVPWDKYCAGRSKILQGFLDRERVFNTPLFFQMYEEQARKNLKRSIRKLRAQQQSPR